jgi:molybdopterin-guanine dinucleotide biosynthesis protein/DNA-binding HxlR family transcriptional regulator
MFSGVLQARPLYDNSADESLFIAPPEWNPVRRAIARRLNTVIIGQRGVGKTTFLYQLQQAMRRDGARPMLVDAAAVETPLELALRLRDRVLGRPGVADRAGEVWKTSTTLVADDPEPPTAGASRAFYDTLQSLSEAPPSVILVDGSSSPDAIYGIFGRMRDTLWQLPHTWIVAIEDDDRATALKPPADAFFDIVVTLEPASTDELTEILSRRSPASPLATLRRIAELANGNPRAALRALGDAEIHDRDPTAAFTERAMLLESASVLGRPHGMLMAELLNRGQASSSEEALQQTLGLTRARLTTLLRELLERGLVVTETERSDSPGRPRTIYRPALRGT